MVVWKLILSLITLYTSFLTGILLFYFKFILSIFPFLVDCNDISNKIYQNIESNYHCFRRLNLTHQIGCSCKWIKHVLKLINFYNSKKKWKCWCDSFHSKSSWYQFCNWPRHNLALHCCFAYYVFHFVSWIKTKILCWFDLISVLIWWHWKKLEKEYLVFW